MASWPKSAWTDAGRHPRCSSVEASSVSGFDGTYFGAVGPGYFKLDMRVGYRFTLRGTTTLEVFGDIFNVTNRANFATPSGNMAAANQANFLNLSDTLQGNSNPQLLQLGLRFAF